MARAAQAEATRIVEPKQARSHATRERLLDAFAGLLEDRSYSEISVADIARAADLTRGTCRVHRWRSRISSAATARHGAGPMPAMSASAN